MPDDEFELDGGSVDLDLDDILGDSAGSLKQTVEAVKPPEKRGRGRPPKSTAPVGVDVAAGNAAAKVSELIGGKAGTSVVFFDIETIPDESRLESFGLDPVPDVPEYTHASNCPNGADLLKGTKEQIIAALEPIVATDEYLASLVALEAAGKKRKGVFEVIKAAGKVRQEAVDAINARRLLLSVTPEFCRIVSLAAAIDERETRCSVVGEDDGGGEVTERQLLQVFWDGIASGAQLCGYGILNFDLPVIYFRSMLLGVKPTRSIDLTPWKGQVLDMYVARFPKGSSAGVGKLKLQAALCGIDIPAEGVDGSQVEELYRAGKFAELRAYNTSDVEISRAYYRKFRGFYW